jgi:hypothetical protein
MLRIAASALLPATCAHASMFVQASVTPQSMGPEFLSDSHTCSEDYKMIALGGQGIIAAFLNIVLPGTKAFCPWGLAVQRH